MKTEADIRSHDGWQLFTSRDIPEAPKGVAAVVHGLCEHPGRYESLTEKRNGAGIYGKDEVIGDVLRWSANRL